MRKIQRLQVCENTGQSDARNVVYTELVYRTMRVTRKILVEHGCRSHC